MIKTDEDRKLEAIEITISAIRWLIIVTTVLFLLNLFFIPKADALIIAGPQIISAPADARDDGSVNSNMQAFNERQGVQLPFDIQHDYGTIPAGTWVNSHMLFLDVLFGQSISSSAYARFDSTILGVMTQENAIYQAATDSLLGAPGTLYGGDYTHRGFESATDDYIVQNAALNISMVAHGPGDWARVITYSVDEPPTFILFGSMLFMIGFFTRKIKNGRSIYNNSNLRLMRKR